MPIARSVDVGPVGNGPRLASAIASAAMPKMTASAAACRPLNMRNVSMRGAIMQE